ncbi:hypothetical protein GRH50_07465 [Campylobacter lari]|nr:hypothetical protein [Campylobacter lari]EDP6895663.1 hypothetical protein [Campylobacter lari]
MEKDILRLKLKNQNKISAFLKRLESLKIEDKEILTHIKELNSKAFYSRLYMYEYNSQDFKYFYSLFEEYENMYNKNLNYENILKILKKRNKINEKGIKIGDVFFSSLGYENTSVEFYQVIAVSEKSFYCQKIFQKYEPFGYDCGYTKPMLNNFDYDKKVLMINNKHQTFKDEDYKRYLCKYDNDLKLHYSNHY